MVPNAILADSCSKINGFEGGESTGAGCKVNRRAAGAGVSTPEFMWAERCSEINGFRKRLGSLWKHRGAFT